MEKLIRFGVSLPEGLLKKFDRLIKEKNYTSRSKAIADLIREELIKKQWQQDKEIAGAVVLVYNHHKRELVDKLIDIQHNFQKIIISNQHIHIDKDNCLEIIAIKGRSQQAQKLNDILKATKGIKHATLSMSSTGKGIE
ncbi:MAG: nickel-responsive transcriptional regulator NikR [Candidatus Omnitrophica bacterium]|nr:nickel-responsive transcriptional regulator NikR [Candidatus Omnitrophota bacterium]MCM8800134.1 nickel-responsive transcriptional regulator NikR [Candidatus Omnitrophota bacterium]